MHIVLVSPPNWDFPNELKTINPHMVSSFHVTEESLNSLSLENGPDLVFLGGYDSSKDSYFDTIVALSIANPAWLVVPFLQDTEFAHVLRAMRKGIREILSSLGPDEIAYIVSRAQAHATRREQMSVKRQALVKNKRVVTRIGIISAKGGDGGSTVVTNIAAAIAKNKDARVLALDLSMELGDLDLYLTTVKPIENLASILAAIDRLDNTLLKIMVHHCSDRLDMIASPDTMEDVFQIAADSVERLIDLVSLHYDFVVIDMGTGLNPVTLGIWKKINKLILVSSLSIPSARRAAQIISLQSRLDSSKTKIDVLINKAGMPSDIAKSDFELAIGQSIWNTLPYDNEVNNAMLIGTPLIEKNRNSKFSRATLKVASGLTGVDVGNLSFVENLWTTFRSK